jgi:teichuronic acid biosynthesis glycosyltransferase TuaC
MKSLVIITHGYPCKVRPIWLAFVREIAHAIARQGVKVTVISPLAVHRAMIGRDPFRSTEDAGDGASVEVFRPRFLSLSSIKIGGWNTALLTLAGFYRAARGVLRRHIRNLPEAVYGHFLYLGGAVAVRLGEDFGLPSFPAVGEGRLCSIESLGRERACRDLSGATAFMANSSELGTLLQSELGFSGDKVGVFPNGVNRRVFYPRNRAAMRKKYGLPPDLMLVCCVGYFMHNKGPARVGEAIRGLPGVGGVFVGFGPLPPVADNIVFRSTVPHEIVPEIMSACDVFVLPTMYEGCCSAILEAMSCGLPVISSDRAFNDEILNDKVSIRIDPMDVPAIRASIVSLQQNAALRRKMGHAALSWAEQFCIDRRARALLAFMESKMAGLREAKPA